MEIFSVVMAIALLEFVVFAPSKAAVAVEPALPVLEQIQVEVAGFAAVLVASGSTSCVLNLLSGEEVSKYQIYTNYCRRVTFADFAH